MIVTLAALKAHLGLTDTDAARDALLTELCEQVEAAFCAACGRADRPFAATAGTSDITEVHDGTGTAWLFARQPVKVLTAVAIGIDSGSPTESLAAADLLWSVGSTMIRRKDAGTFGALDALGVVHLTYQTDVDAPEDVQLAITRATAALYLQRGAEDVRSESEGGVRSEFAAAFEDPTWRAAVDVHREPRVG